MIEIDEVCSALSHANLDSINRDYLNLIDMFTTPRIPNRYDRESMDRKVGRILDRDNFAAVYRAVQKWEQVPGGEGIVFEEGQIWEAFVSTLSQVKVRYEMIGIALTLLDMDIKASCTSG